MKKRIIFTVFALLASLLSFSQVQNFKTKVRFENTEEHSLQDSTRVAVLDETGLLKWINKDSLGGSGGLQDLQSVLDTGSISVQGGEGSLFITRTDTGDFSGQQNYSILGDLRVAQSQFSFGTGFDSYLANFSTTSTSIASESNMVVQDDTSNLIRIGLNTTGGAVVQDNILNFGLRYSQDYSANGVLNNNWLPNWGTVKQYTNSVAETKVDLAPNGSDNLIDQDNKLNPIYLQDGSVTEDKLYHKGYLRLVSEWNPVSAAEQNSWTSVTYGDGRFVAISGNGTNRVMWSDDGGETWNPSSAAEQNSWTSVTYGDGRFVAISSAGTNKVMWSDDGGETWNSASTPEQNHWNSVTYGDGRFVAVCHAGTNKVMWSDDGGETWNSASTPEQNYWLSVTYGDGRFVAVAIPNAGTNRVMWSDDGGETWNPASAAEQNYWNSVTYGDGRFVATSQDGTNRVMWSDDGGETWNPSSAAEQNSWNSVTYGDGKFVAVSGNGTNRVMEYGSRLNLPVKTSYLTNDGESGKGKYIEVVGSAEPGQVPTTDGVGNVYWGDVDRYNKIHYSLVSLYETELLNLHNTPINIPLDLQPNEYAFIAGGLSYIEISGIELGSGEIELLEMQIINENDELLAAHTVSDLTVDQNRFNVFITNSTSTGLYSPSATTMSITTPAEALLTNPGDMSLKIKVAYMIGQF